MKIPNKSEIQGISISCSTDTDFKDFMRLYKTLTAKKYSFLVIDNTLSSYNCLHFPKNIMKEV